MERVKQYLANFKVPSEYIPIGTYNFCSNKITNVKYLIDDHGFKPLLIGSGKTPRIWLYARASENEYVQLIDDNKSLVENFEITINIENKTIQVIAGKNIIKSILKLNFKQVIEVIQLDLRLVGLNIYGDANQLNVGGNKLIKNSMIGAENFIGMSK